MAVKLVDLLRALDADSLPGDLLPASACTPYGDEADLVGAVYVLAARDARKLAPGEPNAGKLCEAIYHLPGFILASMSKRLLFLYVLLLFHRYFLQEGGLAGNSERRRRLARLLVFKWIRNGGKRPRSAAGYVKQLINWLIDGTEPECKKQLSLVDRWPEAVRRHADVAM